MNSNLTNNTIRRSRLKFSLVLAAFFIPLAIALLGYYRFPEVFTSSLTVNHAPLIRPVVTLQPFTNFDRGNNEVTLETLKRTWVIAHRLDIRCTESCSTSLYNSRQARLALGRDANRVQRLLLGDNIEELEAAATEHSDITLLLRSNGGLDKQLKPIVRENGMSPDDAFLIDPLGNVMMAIPVELAPSDLLKDLKKLLKLSKIG